ncbi:hypothetical protein [Nitrosopumilus ureiphilus]|uniref:Uncharacterized protein n=1 Tax=Nitrosopumilus ureiphilus TaxID=1470067 RepID=A0A7D5M6G5_9ARCH|nr:hypothetical protein [Nitrosopumilus ureiphilus]QLH07131.1 hypothetical protein C5F50_08635 [Nitrosopumilus ureiphilus]
MDCVTLVHSVQGPIKENKKIDEMVIRTNCYHDPNTNVYEYEDDFKFNTSEKIRVFESGKYKFVISANYFKETNFSRKGIHNKLDLKMKSKVQTY